MNSLQKENQNLTNDSASDHATIANEPIDKEKASEARLEHIRFERDREFQGFDAAREAKLLRKMDIRLIPLLALLYLMSFLDRGNIGNARLAGLETDLGLVGNQYAWTLTIFFFSYAAFEVPSNLLLKKLRPSVWLPLIMVAWGTVMTLMGLVKNYQGLLVARFFLGVTEAGLFPGVAYYITLWYRRHEAQYRTALFFSAATIAGAFSGILAYAIEKMDGIAGLAGWAWIFILEGIATVVVAIIAFFLLHDFPETASFLTEEERAFVIHRLKYDGTDVAMDEGFRWKYVRQAFLDWQIYLSLFIYWGTVVPLYGISLFLPSIINQIGYSGPQAQLLTVPVYVCACLICILMAFLSDRAQQRGSFVGCLLLLALVGFIIAIASDKPGAKYAGIFIAASGIYPAFPGVVSWLANNLAGSYKRATGMAIQIGVGNLGGGIASNIWRDPPTYKLGNGLTIMFICIGLVGTAMMWVNLKAINARRLKIMQDPSQQKLSDAELSEKGDKAPNFIYTL